jgi:hypothetical protein
MAALKAASRNPKAVLFAASLARDIAQIAGEIEGDCATLRLNAERLVGLPRCVDVAGSRRFPGTSATPRSASTARCGGCAGFSTNCAILSAETTGETP